MGAFVTMMNKLIFSNEIILKRLLVDIRRHNNRGGKTRIAEIDSAISKMTEHRQSLSVLAARGYLDTAVFTQENNSIIIEIEKLKKEKEQIVNGSDETGHRIKALEELIRFTAGNEMLSGFDEASFESFIDHVTVISRTAVTFHLKCGLNLKEVIQ